MPVPKRWVEVAAICGLVCLLFVSLYRRAKGVSDTSQLLATIKLPALPVGVSGARCWSDESTQHVNIKFRATRREAREFIEACSVPYYYVVRIAQGKADIMAIHGMALAPDRSPIDPVAFDHLGDSEADEAGRFRDMVCQKWFETVRNTRHAWFLLARKDPVSYRFWYDLNAGQFYIYWTCS